MATKGTQTIVLQESGYDTGMSFEEYCEKVSQYGNDPREFSDNSDDFVFVSVEYGKDDPHWEDEANDPNWPEDWPLWEYRPK